MSKHPLDEEFQIEGSAFDDNWDDEVEIPENADEQNLELVIKLALTQYKTNVDDMGLVDPKNRIRLLEINRALLETVKDSRYKLEMLKINREKLKGTGKKATKPESDGGVEASKEEEGSVSRSELMERMRLVKK